MANERPTLPPLSPAVTGNNQGDANGGFPKAAPTVPSPSPVPSPYHTPPPRPSK